MPLASLVSDSNEQAMKLLIDNEPVSFNTRTDLSVTQSVRNSCSRLPAVSAVPSSSQLLDESLG
jgi:hypothetical protein